MESSSVDVATVERLPEGVGAVYFRAMRTYLPAEYFASDDPVATRAKHRAGGFTLVAGAPA